MNLSSGPICMVLQKPEVLNQNNNSLKWIFTCRDVWAKNILCHILHVTIYDGLSSIQWRENKFLTVGKWWRWAELESADRDELRLEGMVVQSPFSVWYSVTFLLNRILTFLRKPRPFRCLPSCDKLSLSKCFVYDRVVSEHRKHKFLAPSPRGSNEFTGKEASVPHLTLSLSDSSVWSQTRTTGSMGRKEQGSVCLRFWHC